MSLESHLNDRSCFITSLNILLINLHQKVHKLGLMLVCLLASEKCIVSNITLNFDVISSPTNFKKKVKPNPLFGSGCG